MQKFLTILLLMCLLAACQTAPTPNAPTITPLTRPTELATRTPVSLVNTVVVVPTALFFPTSQLPPTASVNIPPPQSGPYLLSNGRGLSTGNIMNEGNMEIEGYCTQLNPSFGVGRDNERWYCTLNSERVLTLGTQEMDDICIRTYRNPAAYAQLIQGSEIPAFRWRCYANS